MNILEDYEKKTDLIQTQRWKKLDWIDSKKIKKKTKINDKIIKQKNWNKVKDSLSWKRRN